MLNIRPVTSILNGNDDRAKTIREILDLFLPKFKNLSKDTSILIDLPKNLSASVIGTGVSVLTDLYYEIEVNPKTYNNGKEYIDKNIRKKLDLFICAALNATQNQKQKISKYKVDLENANKFTDITPEIFISCVISEIYMRCGIVDFDLFKKSNLYYIFGKNSW